MSNAVHLEFHHRASTQEQADTRANAVFIHARLVASGMSVQTAKEAVEALFEAGRRQGYEDGYDAADIANYRDEFNK